MWKGVVTVSKLQGWKVESSAIFTKWANHPKRYTQEVRKLIKEEVQSVVDRYNESHSYVNAVMFEQATKQDFPDVFSSDAKMHEEPRQVAVRFRQTRVSSSDAYLRRVQVW